jgi:hypothetical protein
MLYLPLLAVATAAMVTQVGEIRHWPRRVRETINLVDAFLGLVMVSCVIASMVTINKADRPSAD